MRPSQGTQLATIGDISFHLTSSATIRQVNEKRISKDAVERLNLIELNTDW